MTKEKRLEIYNRFAPVWADRELRVLDPDKTAERNSEFNVYFFGDPSLQGDLQYVVRNSVPDFHKKILSDMFNENPKYYITCPSGFGKSSIITKFHTIYRIIYFKEPYTIIASSGETIAREYVADIKHHLCENKKILEVYGNYKPHSKSARENKKKWSESNLQFANGSKLRAVGWCTSKIRGSVFGGSRVSLFIGDDPEDLEDTYSTTQMEKNRKWLTRTVAGRVDEDYGKIRVIGNLLSSDCMLAKLRKHTDWQGSIYTALVKDDDGAESSIWEDRFPVKKLQLDREKARQNGELEEWLYEKQNEIPESRESKIHGYGIHTGIYERYNGQNVLVLPDQAHPVPVNIFLAIDPAFGLDEKKHDPRGFVIFAKGVVLYRNQFSGKPYPVSKIWVLEEIKNWMAPDLVLDKAIEIHKKYYLEGIIIEAISGQQIYEPFMNKLAAQDQFYSQNPAHLIYIKYQKANKKKRIYNSLQNRCKLGQLDIHESIKEIKYEMDNFHITENPNLLDALEFGNANSYDCIADPRDVVYEERRHKKYGERDEPVKPRSNFRDWAPRNLNKMRV
ncbi:MAG: hypothetical protein KAS32_18180 [Candidatus Peribacteraceae bacterium]|nr:hypothetical protein [Candidatus Peribacteraceae bacterium]